MMQSNGSRLYKRCLGCYIEHSGYALFCEDCLNWSKLGCYAAPGEPIEQRRQRQVVLVDFTQGDKREVA